MSIVFNHTIAKFLRHLRVTKADAENFSIQCKQQGCCRTFRSLQTYRKHIYRYHKYSVTERLHQEELPVSDGAEGVVMSNVSAGLDLLDSTEHSDGDDVSLADSGECCVVKDSVLIICVLNFLADTAELGFLRLESWP